VEKFDLRYAPQRKKDELLAFGPLVPVVITAPLELLDIITERQFPLFATYDGFALIDTGASVSAVDESVFVELNIPYVDTRVHRTPHGLGDLNLYNASVKIPDLKLDRLPLLRVPGGHFRTPTQDGPDIVMLIGRDILRLLRLVYDGSNSRFSVEV
jgi:hypothetical protein